MSAILKRHEETMIAMLNIIAKHIDKIPEEMLKDIERYNEATTYEMGELEQ